MNKQQRLKTIFSMNPTNEELVQLFGFVQTKENYDSENVDHFSQPTYDIIFRDLSNLMKIRGDEKKSQYYSNYLEIL